MKWHYKKGGVLGQRQGSSIAEISQEADEDGMRRVR